MGKLVQQSFAILTTRYSDLSAALSPPNLSWNIYFLCY